MYDPLSSWNYHEKGFILSQLGEFELSDICYNHSIIFNPNVIQPWLNLGVNMYKRGKAEVSIFFFDMATKIDEDDPIGWYSLGMAYTDLHDYSKALKSHQMAIDLDPKNTIIINAMGISYLYNKKYHESLDKFNEVLLLNSVDKISLDIVIALTNKGMTFFNRNESLNDSKNAIMFLSWAYVIYTDLFIDIINRSIRKNRSFAIYSNDYNDDRKLRYCINAISNRMLGRSVTQLVDPDLLLYGCAYLIDKEFSILVEHLVVLQ